MSLAIKYFNRFDRLEEGQKMGKELGKEIGKFESVASIMSTLGLSEEAAMEALNFDMGQNVAYQEWKIGLSEETAIEALKFDADQKVENMSLTIKLLDKVIEGIKIGKEIGKFESVAMIMSTLGLSEETAMEALNLNADQKVAYQEWKKEKEADK